MAFKPIRFLLSALLLCSVLTPAAHARFAQPRAANLSPQAPTLSETVVISQVYGGGGNNGATYTHDFIELFNRGTSAVDITGWSVQYASASGSTWQLTSLSGVIQPGQYYLVQQAQGTAGSVALPAPDASGSIFMSATRGKVALVSRDTPLAGTCPSDSALVDLVGYGSANCFEGAAGTPELSNTTAALRNEDGCAETDENGSDFAIAAPNPRNSSAPRHLCAAGDSAPSVVSTSPADGQAFVPADSNIQISFSEPVDVTGSWFTISCSSSNEHTAIVSGGPTSYTLDPELDFALAETCTVTIAGAQVTDQDADDPPDRMAADHTWSFTVVGTEPSTELSIGKSGPLAYSSGTPIDYTIVVTVGEQLANDVVLTDTLPAGTSYISDTTGVAPVASGRSVTWQLGSLNPGVHTYRLRLGTDAADDDLVNTVAISTSSPERDPTNNSASSNTAYLVLPIGVVQGVVDDGAEGHLHSSPYASSYVTIQGVIYEKTLSRRSNGGSSYGFFIQNTAATADGDPNSSDGIFVYMSSYTSLIGGFIPEVGDEVIVNGRVSEFYNLTQLSSARLVQHLRSGVDLDAEVPAAELNPPAYLAESNRYWERREGMRVRVPQGSRVIASRAVFSGSEDAELWVARQDVALTECEDMFAQRAYRDFHPCDNHPDQLFDDDNAYRIGLGSMGIKAASGNNRELIVPARIFDTLTNSPAGGVYYAFGKYTVQVEAQPLFSSSTIDPSLNAPPQPANRAREYAVATYNVENLYDYRDDPNDGCDFAGNSGCPGVNPPFNYVPESEAAYRAHLDGIASQIINDLHSPDILLIQEAEDQDICLVQDGALVCGTSDNADGKPDTLQELALAIAAQGGPAYDAAYDRDGADDRGIVSAFLYRADRVALLEPSATDPVLGADPQLVYRSEPLPYNTDVQNPKALNAVLPDDVDTSTGTDGDNVFTRPPQIGLFRVWRAGVGEGGYTDVYAISNHFSSGPDRRVGQRREQANYVAAIVAAVESGGAANRVVVGGDFNVFPRPDDPFPQSPSDQLGSLYDYPLTSLFDVLVAEAPSSAYSYAFNGQYQTLDQIFVTGVLSDELVQVRVAHINADWPAEYDGDGARGISDHDPMVARFAFPAADLSASAKSVTTTSAVAGEAITYTISLINSGAYSATYALSDVLDEALLLESAEGMAVDGQLLTAEGVIESNASVEYHIVARVRRGFGYTIANSAELSVGDRRYTLAAPEVTVRPARRLTFPVVNAN